MNEGQRQGLASLPMYDLPEVRWATDALWAAIRDGLWRRGVGDVPEALDRTAPGMDAWRSPHLVLSQTCGYPLVTALPAVTVVGTPVYDADGDGGATYRSAVVVRRDAPFADLESLRGAVAAVNEVTSHSGYNVFRATVAPLAKDGRFFSAVRVTGAHADSVAAVASGTADVAAIDNVTWALLTRHRPEAVSSLRVLAWTESAPALPFITAAADSAPMLAALQEALHAPETETARAALLLRDVVPSSRGDYEVIRRVATQAAAAGYPDLR